MDATQTPTTIHLEFDRMCEALDEFEPLPDTRSDQLQRDEDSDETSLDPQILACLVSPV